MKRNEQRVRKGPRMFWAEFYSLSEDCGIMFAATGLQLFGEILRIELPVTKGLDPGYRWLDVSAADGEYCVNGRSWTDFGCSPTPWKAFRRLTARQARFAIERAAGVAKAEEENEMRRNESSWPATAAMRGKDADMNEGGPQANRQGRENGEFPPTPWRVDESGATATIRSADGRAVARCYGGDREARLIVRCVNGAADNALKQAGGLE